MSNYLFVYRAPSDFTPGDPDAMAAWTAWFRGISDHVVELGKPVFTRRQVGDAPGGTELGGYSLISAADLAPVAAALAAAQKHGTSAFDASGDAAGLECKGGDDWSSPPGPDDIGLDAVSSLPAGGALMSVRYVIRLAALVATPAWRATLPQHPGSHELPQIR